MAVLGWLAVTAFFAVVPCDSPLTPPQAASSSESPARPAPVAPALPTNARRERRSSTSSRSTACSMLSSVTAVLLGDDEGVLRVPGQLDLAARPEGLRLAAVEVLRDDDELLPAPRGDHVLDRDPQERGDAHVAAQDVDAGRRV